MAARQGLTVIYVRRILRHMSKQRKPEQPDRQVRKARTGAGRPEKPAEERLYLVPIRFPRALLDAVDVIARADIERPTRSVMIRRLVAEAIAARKGKS